MAGSRRAGSQGQGAAGAWAGGEGARHRGLSGGEAVVRWVRPAGVVAGLAVALVLGGGVPSLTSTTGLGLGGAEARADIYVKETSDGVIHFTNIEPRGGERKKWKVLYKTGPGKAAAIRGSCERCDRVPASDRSPERYGRYDEHIAECVALYQLPEALVRAVIHVESDYDPRVVSSVGAMGLMQLMPSTVQDHRVTDPFEPRENILGGCRHLRVLANKYNGDLDLTLAAYSAGPGAVAKWGGVPPYETTQRYMRMVLSRYEHYKAKLARGEGGGAARAGADKR